jgi:methylphosphotriester-DNA--protein-cysteine methyltransferase
MKALIKCVLAVFLIATTVGCNEKTIEQVSNQPKRTVTAYVASVNREPFHRPDCKWARRISLGNLQTFQTREEAIKAGHRPCKVCEP